MAEAGVIRSYRDLKAWQRAIDLAEACYHLSEAFPRSEQYGLTSQLRRASVSVAANIAEGWGRQTRPAFVNFLRIAQGSLKEVETHLIIAVRVRLTEAERADQVLELCEEVGRIVRGLIAKLERLA